MKTDILVIGTGIAGFSFALKIAAARPDLKITLLNKGERLESNTRYAQGGIAVVLDRLRDSFGRHIDDTIAAGGGHCKPHIVEMVVRQAPDRLEELLRWGVDFDRSGGNFHMGLEGGHSCPRILHHKDMTGLEIERKLSAAVQQAPNIHILNRHMALDLICTEDEHDGETPVCRGAKVLDIQGKRIMNICAGVTLLATGGSGQVYAFTTNPGIATGDGVAMAARAGARISDMQYMQFHPTALFNKNGQPGLLISEAVRGAGATLLNRAGRRFVFDSDSRGELATRDIVSAAVFREMQGSGEPCVWLDCRHLDPAAFRAHFPFIMQQCLSAGYDPLTMLLPVAPAAHYQCGGIAIDHRARTTIPGLYALGECACSGLHGTNRLASNSLLEALVFAHEAFCAVSETDRFSIHDIPGMGYEETDEVQHPEATKFFRTEIRSLMSRFAGVGKSREGLELAGRSLVLLKEEFEHLGGSGMDTASRWEVRNMLEVALLIIRQSIQSLRTETSMSAQLHGQAF